MKEYENIKYPYLNWDLLCIPLYICFFFPLKHILRQGLHAIECFSKTQFFKVA